MCAGRGENKYFIRCLLMWGTGCGTWGLVLVEGERDTVFREFQGMGSWQGEGSAFCAGGQKGWLFCGGEHCVKFCLAWLVLELVWRGLTWEYLEEFLHVLHWLLEGCCHGHVVSHHHVMIAINGKTEPIQPIKDGFRGLVQADWLDRGQFECNGCPVLGS